MSISVSMIDVVPGGSTAVSSVEREPVQRQPDIPALTSIRFFLASAICLAHFSSANHLAYADGIQKFLEMGLVPAFFCLSGFVLALNYRSFTRPEALREFYAARIARLIPLYWFALVLSICLFSKAVLVPDVSQFFPSLIANLFLVQAWCPSQEFWFGFNPPAYSLSIEAFFYLLLPVIISTSLRQFGLWLVLALVLAWVPSLTDGTTNWSIYLKLICPLSRLFEFVAGIGAALVVVNQERVRAVLNRLSFGQMSVIQLFLAVLFFKWGSVHFALSATLFSLVAVSLSFRAGLLARVLSWPVLEVLGRCSYAMFLLHYLLLRCFLGYDINRFGLSIGFALYFGVTVVAAYCLHTLVEEPWRMVLSKRRKPAPADLAGVGANRRPFLKPTCLTVLSFLAISTFVTVGFPWLLETTDQLTRYAQESSIAPLSGSRNISFGKSATLLKAYRWKRKGGVLMTCYWSAGTSPRTVEYLAVHVIDERGNILSQFDHKLYPARAAGEPVWRDSFTIPFSHLKNARGIALAVYDASLSLAPVSGGRRDWGDRRLVFSLKEE